MCDTLPTVLNLAAAGNIDLASASDMVTDAMSALGMGIDESEKMVDQMAKTASSTNTSVSQLGEGILTIGATAKSIKGGTAELNTALGILANNGIKGAEGGTHLRNVILSLQSPTDTAAACMEQLGLDVYDSEGNMRSLNDILGDLNKSMEGMTSADKNNIISTIFNKTDLSSVNALLANTGDTWDDLQQSIIDSGGAAQQMADTQLDNLSGQITILKSALEGLAISFGELLMPVIKQVVDVIQKMVDKLNALDPSVKETIVKIALVAATLGPLLIVVGKVISSVGSILSLVEKIPSMITAVQGGITALTGALGVSMGVILAIVAAIAALVAAFVHLWNTNEDFKNSILGIWEQIKTTFTGLTQGIVDRLNALGFNFESFTDVLKAAWDALCNLLAPVFEGVFNQIANIFDTVTDVILGILDVFIGLFTGDWEQCWNGIKGIFTGI
jgi:TP901 family phage tail tape measure protein